MEKKRYIFKPTETQRDICKQALGFTKGIWESAIRFDNCYKSDNILSNINRIYNISLTDIICDPKMGYILDDKDCQLLLYSLIALWKSLYSLGAKQTSVEAAQKVLIEFNDWYEMEKQ